MKKVLTYGGLGIVIVAAGVYAWMQFSAIRPDRDDGFHLKCTLAECGWAFTIPREQARTYPRDPNGQGFQCPQCGKFSGQIATRCEQCGEWYVGSGAVGREAGCPKCRSQPSGK